MPEQVPSYLVIAFSRTETTESIQLALNKYSAQGYQLVSVDQAGRYILATGLGQGTGD